MKALQSDPWGLAAVYRTCVSIRPHVVKWVEKEERSTRRDNLVRDQYSGTGAGKIPQNREFGVLQNRVARRGQLPRTPTPGWGHAAPGIDPKGTRHSLWFPPAAKPTKSPKPQPNGPVQSHQRRVGLSRSIRKDGGKVVREW